MESVRYIKLEKVRDDIRDGAGSQALDLRLSQEDIGKKWDSSGGMLSCIPLTVRSSFCSRLYPANILTEMAKMVASVQANDEYNKGSTKTKVFGLD